MHSVATKGLHELGTRLLRIAEVAELLAISRSKVYAMAQQGSIPVVRVGSSVRVPEDRLQRWLEQRTSEPRSA